MKNIKWDLEIWKPIPDYSNYMVSNLGRVKSINWHRGKIEKYIKPYITHKGYLRIRLTKDAITKQFSIHRLVAKTFIPNPDNLPQVNHINEDKTDNRVENLEWCTNEYNHNYGSRNNKTAKALSKPVLQFTLDGEFVKRWNSAREIERETGFKVSECCNGKLKTSHNYKWGYADNYEKIKFNVFDLELYRKKVS